MQPEPGRNFEPSIGLIVLMPVARCLSLALIVLFAAAAPAAAEDVLVLGKDGEVRSQQDRFAGGGDLLAPRAAPRGHALAAVARSKPKKKSGPSSASSSACATPR